MGKKLFLPVLAGLCYLSGFAQPDKKSVDQVLTSKKIEADTSKKKDWKTGGTLALNISQQTSSYWVGTTEDYSLSLGLSADLYSNYAKGKNTLDNTLKANYAFLNNQSGGTRKTGDFIDLYSKYGHLLNDSGTLAFATILNGRTQFSDGYDYSYPNGGRRRISGFFAPANILITPGLDWRPTKNFSLFVSPIAAKWVIVTNDPYSYYYPGGIKPDNTREKALAELYGVDPERKVDFQVGAFLSANFTKEILKNVMYTSRLDLYSNYLNKPQNIDVFWTNNLLFKVNKWLGITYQWNVAYDDNYSPNGKNGPRTQFLGNLGIGVNGKF
ncbi:MAG: DUF3078 domain-containing protein [Bacteroidota bacterium]